MSEAVSVLDPSKEWSGEPYTELTNLADKLYALADGVAAEPDPDLVDRTIRRTLNETSVWDLLNQYAGDRAGISRIVGALDYLDEQLGGEDNWGLKVLTGVKNDTFTKTLQLLFDDEHPSLYAIFDRAVGEEPLSRTQEASLMFFIEGIAHPTFEYMSDWPTPFSKELPPFLQRFVERPYFARVCLDSTYARIKESEAQSQYMSLGLAREAECSLLLDVLGIDEKRCEEYRLAIAPRTVIPRKAEGEENTEADEAPAPSRPPGSLNSELWYATMRTYIEYYQALGAERVETLRSDWGIINLDRYGFAQLERMCRLSESIAPDGTVLDPEFLEQLRSTDVTIVVSNVLGDYNNSATADIRSQEVLREDDENQSVLFFEVREPWGVYAPFVRLARRFGIKASTIAVSTHGNTGSFNFGEMEHYSRTRFDIGVTDAEPDERYDMDGFFDVRDTQAARFFSDYMVPSRVTGLRHVLLLACKQALRLVTSRLSHVEALASLARPEDAVAVSGSALEPDVDRATDQLLEHTRGGLRQAQLLTYQRLSETVMRVTLSSGVGQRIN